MQSISSLIAMGTPSRTEIGSPGGHRDNDNSLRMLRIKLLKIKIKIHGTPRSRDLS